MMRRFSGFQDISQEVEIELSNSSQMEKKQQYTVAKIDAPVFSHVFKRILYKSDKSAYYGVRLLNQFHKSQFKQNLQCMDIQFKDLQSVTESSLANYVRILNISIPDHLKDLSQLCYASPIYFPNIQNIYAEFIQTQEYSGENSSKYVNLTQPLVIQQLNLQHVASGGGSNDCTSVTGLQDVTIIDSVFQGYGLFLFVNNRITISRSSFKSVNGYGLGSINAIYKIIIENVIFENCSRGLVVHSCKKDIVIKAIKVLNCIDVGVGFNYVTSGATFEKQNSEIISCKIGIHCVGQDGRLRDCVVRYCRREGVHLESCTIYYWGIQLSQNDYDVVMQNGAAFLNQIL